MRSTFQRIFLVFGLAAYVSFATGLTAALHDATTHAHSAPAILHQECSEGGQSQHDSGSEPASDNRDCATCHQIATAAKAALEPPVHIAWADASAVQTAELASADLLSISNLSSQTPRAPPIA